MQAVWPKVQQPVTKKRRAVKTDRLRVRLAQEAAKIMVEEGVADFLQAKRKAASRLGIDERHAPNNAEIQQEILAYQALFKCDSQPELLRKKRQAAAKAMQFFGKFKPMLTGSVLHGTCNPHSDINLHLFLDHLEELIWFFGQNGIPVDQRERKFRVGDDQWKNCPSFRFHAGEETLSISVFDERSRSRPPLSPVDGKPMQRATLEQLELLLTDTANLL